MGEDGQGQGEGRPFVLIISTPSGYLIDLEGRIASELAMGAEPLLALAAGKSEIRSPKPEH